MNLPDIELDQTIDPNEIIDEVEHLEQEHKEFDTIVAPKPEIEDGEEDDDMTNIGSSNDDEEEDEEDIQVHQPPNPIPTTTPIKPTTKMDKARIIFAEMYGKPGIARKDIIQRFMKDAECTSAGAATYYQILTKKDK